MRIAWLAVLMIGVGCRAAAPPAADFSGRELAFHAAPSLDAHERSSDSAIVPVAYLARPDGDAGDKDDALPVPGGLSHAPLVTDGTAELVTPAVPLQLTLEAAIQTTLERNPDLQTVRSSEPVAQAAFGVATTYPFNPQFQTQVAPYAQDRFGDNGSVAQQHVLVQTFELAHQRRFRAGGAAADWQRVRHDIRAAELISVAQTERLFFATLYQRDLRDLARTIAKLNTDLVGVIERRLQAGQAIRADVALARLQAQSARRQHRLTEANYQTAMMNLLSYLNLPETVEVDVRGRWRDWRWRPLAEVLSGTHLSPPADPASVFSTTESETAIEPLVKRMVAERPDVVAARTAVAVARQNLALAEAMRIPNLQIGPMWQRDETATEFWGVQAQIDIPAVNTGTPLVRQRLAELRQKQVTASRLEQKALLEARSATLRYERARQLVEQSRGELAVVVPDGQAMPEVLKPFEDQFQAGQITLLQVFAARTTLTQSQQSYLDLLNELAQAAADVTQATSLPAQQLILAP